MKLTINFKNVREHLFCFFANVLIPEVTYPAAYCLFDSVFTPEIILMICMEFVLYSWSKHIIPCNSRGSLKLYHVTLYTIITDSVLHVRLYYQDLKEKDKVLTQHRSVAP